VRQQTQRSTHLSHKSLRYVIMLEKAITVFLKPLRALNADKKEKVSFVFFQIFFVISQQQFGFVFKSLVTPEQLDAIFYNIEEIHATQVIRFDCCVIVNIITFFFSSR
jgi:ribonucleotide reductase beta subunit family protein with ferritin-like domain